MSYFKYKSHNIFYEEMGEGKPLLLLHGNTASSNMFADIASIFATDRKVILIDFLGYGKSDRVDELDEDLWFDEAMQAICFLDEKKYKDIDVIGSSGGAIAAINIALERPDIIDKVVADSFEGERALPDVTEGLKKDREASKRDPGAIWFYDIMNGPDWERVVDTDTRAVIAHAEHIGEFYHKPLSELKPEILLTGSREDNFVTDEMFFYDLYKELIGKIGHGEMHIFDHGEHPAMLSNRIEFIEICRRFFL